jgi:hypothetical protein
MNMKTIFFLLCKNRIGQFIFWRRKAGGIGFRLQKRAKGALHFATALRPTREKSLSAKFF